MRVRAQEDPIPFWLAVEAFTPQPVPKLSSSRDDVPFVGDYRAKHAVLPWLAGAGLGECPPNRAWEHTVYVGVFDLETAWRVLPSKADDNPNARGRQSAVMLLTVRQNGSLVENSFVCSQCVWATGRYLRAGHLGDVFSDFTADEKQWRERFHEVVIRNRIWTGGDTTEGRSTHLLNKEDLWDLLTTAVRLAEVEGRLTLGDEGMGLWISSRQIPLRDEGPDPEQSNDFLNSFFSRDLHELSKRGHGHESVRRYLGSGPARGGIDVDEHPGVVYDSVAPDLIPDGRWPADPTQALSVSQQFAVNRIIADVADASDALFAVNGPPGTGKTTLLRDIIAALVTRRAQALAECARSADAFTKTEYSWTSTTDKRRSVRQLRHSIRGAEIIIASSNNGAVDNISLEIPGEKAVFAGYRDVSDYFPELATALLRNGEKPTHDVRTEAENTAWGLVSGRLGSASNRSSFANTLMFGSRPPRMGADSTIGLSDHLGASPGEGVSPWGAAREAFLVAKDRVNRLRAERQGLHLAHRERPRLVTAIAAARSQSAELEHHVSAAEDSAGACRLTASAALDEQQTARTDVAVHSRAKPNTLELILTLGRSVKTWRATHERMTTKLLIASEAAETAAAESRASDRLAGEIRSDRDRAERHVTILEGRLASADAALRDYGHPDRVPTEEWFSPENTDREKSSPWLDKDFNDARSLLFLAALDLHRSFLYDQRRILRSNLFAAYDVLTNATPSTTDPRAVRAAWESLFLVVPTVTTTFASLPRVFGSLKTERLGWLLIDEAGQAAPQHALCGIWRTSNSVLVGDPLQLQPVVSLPVVHQRTLLKMTGTSDRWLPASNPAQVLADRNARYVARIRVPGLDEITVGSPLRVHRRCDNPMFDIVNDSVYGGMMVHGGQRTETFMIGHSEAPPSAWFDVAGISWNGHSSPEQIALLDDMLGSLRRAGHPMSEVLVISPFSDVARALRRSASRFGMDASKQAGTIHTAQGKEAEIVILVLGGRTSGARNWAAATPNLFNVAVSRARRRIFVIGSHRDWATLPYFQHLAAALERHPDTAHFPLGKL